MKRYVVRKYILAKSAEEAVKKEKKQGVDEIYLDERWEENFKSAEAMGFNLVEKPLKNKAKS